MVSSRPHDGESVRYFLNLMVSSAALDRSGADISAYRGLAR
jgi:hypothetical protein